MILLYILWDDWPIFMISGSNQQLQQELGYTQLKPDYHSWWISKMQSVSRLFFVWALLLTVHTWNSSPLRSNLFRLQCTCTVPTTSGRPHGSPLAWVCQWPSSQLLSSSQLSHNDSLWAYGITKSPREQGLDYREGEQLSWYPSWSNSQWEGWSCGLKHCPGIFEIHQLWQSGFSRVYSNSCCSCWFKPEIIKIGQSSHKMYSNIVVNFQESTTILNTCTKKSLETYWRHYVLATFQCSRLCRDVKIASHIQMHTFS